MADVEILVRLSNAPGGREKGDIVAVKPLPHAGWGRCEGPPDFEVVRLRDVDPVDFLMRYATAPLISYEGGKTLIRRGSHKLSFAGPLPAKEIAAKDALFVAKVATELAPMKIAEVK